MEWYVYYWIVEKAIIRSFGLKNNKLINNSSIIKNKIGRVRDIEINASGQILLLSDDKSTYSFKK